MNQKTNSPARRITQFLRAEIRTLFRSAKPRIKEHGLDIRLASKSNQVGRILIVIPRSVGSAVTRNKIRRRIKNIFYQKKLFALPYDWLVFVSKPAADLSFAQLEALLLKALA